MMDNLSKEDAELPKKKYKEIGLHASRLEFDHPTTGEHMVFKHEPEGGAFAILDLDEF